MQNHRSPLKERTSLCLEVVQSLTWTYQIRSCRLSVQRLLSLLQEVRTGKMEEDEKDSTWYLSDFDSKTADKEIIIGSISLQDIEMQERKMENDRLVMLQKEAARYRRREEHLTVMEDAAKLRAIKRFEVLDAKLKQKGKKVVDKDEKAARQDETRI